MESVIGPCGHSYPPPGPCRCHEEPEPAVVPRYRRGDVMVSRNSPARLIIEMVGTRAYFVRHLTGYSWAEPSESAWYFKGLEDAMVLEHHEDLPELEDFLDAATVRAVHAALAAHMEENPEQGTLAMLEVVQRLLEGRDG